MEYLKKDGTRTLAFYVGYLMGHLNAYKNDIEFQKYFEDRDYTQEDFKALNNNLNKLAKVFYSDRE